MKKKTYADRMEEVAHSLNCWVFNTIFLIPGLNQDASNDITNLTVKAFQRLANKHRKRGTRLIKAY